MFLYKVVQIWPGLIYIVYTQISPGHIWTTLYIVQFFYTSYNVFIHCTMFLYIVYAVQ